MDGRSCAEIRRRDRGGAAAVALLAVCAAVARAGADDGRQREAHRQEGEARLQKIQQEIEDLRRRLEQGETTSGSVLDAIDELDLRVALLRRESESLRAEVRATAERERAARFEAESLQTRLAQTESGLRGYLRETYKVSPARQLRLLPRHPPLRNSRVSPARCAGFR